MTVLKNSTGLSRFPSWLGKNSTASKNRRLISQIQLHALASSSHLRASSKDLRLVMWKLLQKKLTRPLQMGADGIDEVIATMQDFGLDREDWGIICEELGFCGIPKKDRPAIETKVKSAFSRQVGGAVYMCVCVYLSLFVDVKRKSCATFTLRLTKRFLLTLK